MPAELFFQLTGQQRQGLAAAATYLSQKGHHHHHHHHQHQHSQASHGRESTRSSRQISHQQAEEVMPQGQCQAQQQAGCQLQDPTSSSVGASRGLYLTPRTAQEFGSGLRQQVQAKVDAEVQQQMHLVRI